MDLIYASSIKILLTIIFINYFPYNDIFFLSITSFIIIFHNRNTCHICHNRNNNRTFFSSDPNHLLQYTA